MEIFFHSNQTLLTNERINFFNFTLIHRIYNMILLVIKNIKRAVEKSTYRIGCIVRLFHWLDNAISTSHLFINVIVNGYFFPFSFGEWTTWGIICINSDILRICSLFSSIDFCSVDEHFLRRKEKLVKPNKLRNRFFPFHSFYIWFLVDQYLSSCLSGHSSWHHVV